MDNEIETLGSVVLKEVLSYLGIKSPTLANNIGAEYKRLQNIETKKTKKISGDLASMITNKYPEFSLDWLITGKGSMLVESPSRVEVESNVSPVRTGDLQWMEIPLVPYKACAGVLAGFGDPIWQEDKQTMQVLVDQRLHGDYVIYEVYGDSMNDGSAQAFLEGDFLLCRLLPQSDWQYGIKKRTATYCVIATHTEGIVLKQVTHHDKAEGIITCHSLNPDYSDYDLKLSEVQALFCVERLAQRNL